MNQIDELNKKQKKQLQASIAKCKRDETEQQIEWQKQKTLVAEKRVETAEKKLADMEQQHKTEMNEKEQKHKIEMDGMHETHKKELMWERGRNSRAVSQSTRSKRVCDSGAVSQCKRSNERVWGEKDGPVCAVPWFCGRCDLMQSTLKAVDPTA